MIYIRQLHQELDKLLKAAQPVSKEFDDPFYIAWMIDAIFNGKAPSPEQQGEFMEIMKARQSSVFRTFWNQYKAVGKALSHFQIVNMGIIPESDRIKYQKKFMAEHKEEVPF